MSPSFIILVASFAPTIVGAKDATKIIKDGDTITVDAITGRIYKGEAKVF